jgi:NAD(P)-dependent dehydrogenase (short-subunit alcohol dehydrogenase family)
MKALQSEVDLSRGLQNDCLSRLYFSAPLTRIALITGANRGIGLSVVKALSQEGIHPVIAARDFAAGIQASDELEKAGVFASVVAIDITNSELIHTSVSTLISHFGKVDILINNAGVFPESREASFITHQYAEQYPELEQIQHAIDTNLMGTLRMIHAILPTMVSHRFGRIVNVSSDMAMMPPEATTNWQPHGGFAIGYRLSKNGINALTRLIASDVNIPNIKINACSPGCVRTRMGRDEAFLTADEGAETIAWLALLPHDGPTGGIFRDKKPIDRIFFGV